MERYEYKIMDYVLDGTINDSINSFAKAGWRIINFPEPHQGFEYRNGLLTVIHTVYVVFERLLPEEA